MNKHILNQYFEKIFCIVRSDQLEHKYKMQERFDKLGIKAEFYYGQPISIYNVLKKGLNCLNDKNIFCDSSNRIAATLSHLNIIQRAKNEGWRNVFIFEHQNMFRKDFNEQIEKYINTIPTDYDVVYLYCNFYEWCEHNQVIVDDLWFSPYYTVHNNAYGINSKFYDEILNQYYNNFFVIDQMTRIMQLNTKYKFIAALPNLCAQEIQIEGCGEDINYYVNVFDYNPNFAGKTVDDFF